MERTVTPLIDGTEENGWKPKFLLRLAKTRSVTAACRYAVISRDTAYKHRESDPDFAARWDEARLMAVEDLEESALERAMAGDTTLTIFLLKAWKPKEYRDVIHLQNLEEEARKLAAAMGITYEELMDETEKVLAENGSRR